MGRLVLAEEAVQSYLDTLLAKNQHSAGLIVGQLTSDCNYAVMLMRTPPEVESDNDDEDIELASPAKDDVLASTDSSIGPSLSEILKWLPTHAKQVRRMLPGGLNVIGIYALAPAKILESMQPALRQVLFTVYKVLNKGILSDSADTIKDRFLLQTSSDARKLSCKAFNVTDVKSTAVPVDWKTQLFLDHWLRLETCLAVKVNVPITQKASLMNLSLRLQNSLTNFYNSIWHSMSTINGMLRLGFDLLDPTAAMASDKKKKSKDNKTRSPSAEIPNLSTYQVDLLLSASDKALPARLLGDDRIHVEHVTNDTESPLMDCMGRLCINGCLRGLAFVHSKTAVHEAIQAIKWDLIRSLVSRCELLAEDLEVTDEEKASREYYCTPKRVFASLPGSPIELSDYVFDDETTKDTVDRFSELIDVRLEADSLHMDLEKAATIDDVLNASNAGAEDSDGILGGKDAELLSQTEKKPYTNILILILSGLVAILAVLLGWLIFIGVSDKDS